MLQKNDIIQLTITSATAEGSGVGKTADGMAVFVPQNRRNSHACACACAARLPSFCAVRRLCMAAYFL